MVRMLQGAKSFANSRSFEGKAFSIIVILCLAFMVWDTNIMGSAYADEHEPDANSDAVELAPAGEAVENVENYWDGNSNYEVHIGDGEHQNTKREVTVIITGNNDTSSYDGEEHAVTGYEVEISNSLYTEDDFSFSGTAEASRTDAGQTYMGLSEEQFANNDSSFDVTFVVIDGYQEIDPIDATVTIVGNNSEDSYDGTEHCVFGYTAKADTKLYDVDQDFTFSGPDSAARKDVVEGEDNDGKTDMGLEKEQFENTNENFDTVTFEVTDGFQKITPQSVTVTTGSGEKEYDGTALTNSEAGIDGLVEGESVTLTATGTQTEVGSSVNTYDIEWDNAIETNYAVTDDLGTLEVTENTARVTLTAPSAEKVYDSTALTADGTASDDPITSTGLPEGFTVAATATGSQTNVGQSANVVNDGYVIKNAGGVDKTENFTNVSMVDGTLKVTPRAITLTSSSGNKAYDGTALVKNNPKKDVKVTSGSFANGESFTYIITGAQTLVGSSENAFTYKAGKGTKLGNYEVTTIFGMLTVTEGANPGGDPVNPEGPNSHLTIVKTAVSKPKNGDSYHAGETIVYQIMAVNDGDLTLKDVTVTDELTGDTWQVGVLPPNAKRVFVARYTVTGNDALVGQVQNVASATGKTSNSNEADVPVTPGVDTEPVSPALTPTPTPTTTPTPTPTTTPAVTPSGPTSTSYGSAMTSPTPSTSATPVTPATSATPTTSATPSTTPTPTTPKPEETPKPATAEKPQSASKPMTTAAAGDGDKPKAEPADDAQESNEDSWSLFGTLTTLAIAIISIVLLTGLVGNRPRGGGLDNPDDPEEATLVQPGENGGGNDSQIKRKRFLRLFSLVPALAAIVALVLTQDFSQPMVIGGTQPMLFSALGIVQVVDAILCR